MILILSPHTDVFLVTERQPPALGNPDLSIGDYIGRLGVRTIDRRHFTLDGFIAEISAGIPACFAVFPLLLSNPLPVGPPLSPFAPHVFRISPPRVDSVPRPGVAAR